MSTEVVLQGENASSEIVLHKYKQIQLNLQSQIHEHKKALLEASTQLQFERARGNQFQQKYKTAIRYQNEEKQLKKIMNQLNQKLRIKEDQILQLLKSEQQKKKKISQLQSDLQELQTINQQFEQKLKQIQQGAVSAILEKQGIIAQLQDKLHEIELNESTNSSNLNVIILQLEEKYKQLQQRSEATKIDLESIIEQKEEDFRQMHEKQQHQKQRLQQRITRLQQQIQDYEKHIEHLNEQRNQEQNLEQKYYIVEQKLRKSQKKNHQLQGNLNDTKKQQEQSLVKLSAQQDQHRNLVDQIKSLKLKVKDLNAQIKDKQKTHHQEKTHHDKSISQITKKILHLQNDKKKINDSLETKNIQIQRLRVEIEQKVAQLLEQKNRKTQNAEGKIASDSRLSLAAQIKIVNSQLQLSPTKLTKKQSEDQSRIIQKYRHQIKDLEQNNSLLSRKLEQKTKQLQILRERLVSESGSASRSPEQQKLLRTIEDLNSHIKKVENSLMIHKLKYAEDESYWSMKEKNYKIEMENSMKQSKRQKSQLLQRIDRMKKTVAGKDKKMDYYQSGFK